MTAFAGYSESEIEFPSIDVDFTDFTNDPVGLSAIENLVGPTLLLLATIAF